jgi:putative transposase
LVRGSGGSSHFFSRMARESRIVVPNAAHHVVARGVDRMRIFRNGYDKGRYLKRVAAIAQATNVQIHAYCLMENHVHFVLTPGAANSLARFFSRLHTWWAMWVNRKYGRTGHLFQSRYHSSPLGEQHCWNAIRYVELNAVRACLVTRPEDWQWSSTRDHLRLRPRPPVPLTQVVSRSLPFADWRELLHHATPEDDEALRRAHRCSQPCGSSQFVQQIVATYRPLRQTLAA